MNSQYLIGIDEVGRGPVAGPVTICAFKILESEYEKLLAENFFDKLRDSKKLSEKKREEWFAKFSELEKHKIIEYSCLLSHLKAFIQFSKSPYSTAIIFEDDVSFDFKPYWQTSLQECIKNAPKDWEILQISYTNGSTFPTKLYSPTKLSSGAYSYAINKKGVLRFLKQFHLHVDKPHVTDCLFYEQMKSYTYQYPFFTYTTKDSEIHTDHIKKIHLPNKQKMENYLRTRDFPLKPDILFVTSMKRIDVNALKVPYTLILYLDSTLRKKVPLLTNIIVRGIEEVKQSTNQKYEFLSHAKYLYPHYQFYSWVDL
jgi:GR25 family glycosyltransferase involved in LPS biosynthesis